MRVVDSKFAFNTPEAKSFRINPGQVPTLDNKSPTFTAASRVSWPAELAGSGIGVELVLRSRKASPQQRLHSVGRALER